MAALNPKTNDGEVLVTIPIQRIAGIQCTPDQGIVIHLAVTAETAARMGEPRDAA